MKTVQVLSIWMAIGSTLTIATFVEAANHDNTPLQIEQTFEAHYPPSLLSEGIRSGEVGVMITIDDKGILTDSMITRYTHPQFAAEALRAMQGWKYTPARVNGVPVSVRTELNLLFEAKGQVMTLDAGSTLRQLTAFGYRADFTDNLCSVTELDAQPAPTHTVSPQHPGMTRDGKVTPGRAVLEFIIDEKGTPRMPVVVSTTDADFATTAADALSQWRFTPPLRHGKPVAVKVRQEFVFSADTDSPSSAGSPTPRLSLLTR